MSLAFSQRVSLLPTAGNLGSSPPDPSNSDLQQKELKSSMSVSADQTADQRQCFSSLLAGQLDVSSFKVNDQRPRSTPSVGRKQRV